MNALEEQTKQQKEYLGFLGRQIEEETKTLQRIKEEQIGFIRQLKEKEAELEGKRKEIESYWRAYRKEKENLQSVRNDVDKRMQRLEILKKTMEETGELGKWLSSKKLIFLDKSKVATEDTKDNYD